MVGFNLPEGLCFQQRRCVLLIHRTTGGGVHVDHKYGMTTVDLKNLAYMDEPFVQANDVAQVFYVKDMSTKQKKKRKNSKVYITR